MIASHMESAVPLVGIEQSRRFWTWVTVTFAHFAQTRWGPYQLAFKDWCDDLGDENLVKLYRDARADRIAFETSLAQIRHLPISDWDAMVYELCHFSNDEAAVIANNQSDELPALTDPLSIIESSGSGWLRSLKERSRNKQRYSLEQATANGPGHRS
jgi:hypothetical protein